MGCSAAYGGTALAFRDRLIIDWNKTQQSHTFADQKRVYCKIGSPQHQHHH
jgi:starch phosphorylase